MIHCIADKKLLRTFPTSPDYLSYYYLTIHSLPLFTLFSISNITICPCYSSPATSHRSSACHSGPYIRIHNMSTPFGRRQLKALPSAYASILNKHFVVYCLYWNPILLDRHHESPEVDRLPYMQGQKAGGKYSECAQFSDASST